MDDCDVMVVGAGLAGLTAARELSGAGRGVRLLEGRRWEQPPAPARRTRPARSLVPECG